MRTGFARARVQIQGAVQGVGYRPFVWRLARDLGLTGWVSNTCQGVIVEAEGPAGAVASLVTRLKTEAPPVSHRS